MIPPLLEPTMDGGIARYELSLTESEHTYVDGVAASTLAYNDQSIFGPTLLWPSGGSLALEVTNGLDEVTTTHWHGADVPAEADGGPWTTIEPDDTWVAEFDVIQPAATLWYHPHRNGTTAEQVYAGAVGLIIVEDDNPNAAMLPNTYGVDDIPIILQDKEFDGDGQLVFEINDAPVGDLNDDLTVNGTIDPYVTVPDGFVRLRVLNGNQARVQELSVDAGTMWKVAGDGGLLREPVAMDSIELSPGDRAELIVDTSSGTTALLDEDFGRVIELRVDPALPAPGDLPDQLAEFEDFAAAPIDNERSFVLDETDGDWVINGDSMDMGVINETIRFGDTERWTVTSEDGVHAFHVHQTQFQIVEINGAPPGPEDAGWEDTVLLEEGDEVVLVARFDSYTNPDTPYMFHCHVLDHEEDGMMGQFQVLEG
ncbi:MAG: multicopper oxidase domain-containing protein [Actinomycetota bacterium]